MKTMLTKLTRVLVAGILTTLMLSGTANAVNATTDLMWFDRSSGQVSTWLLNGHGNVLGAQSMNWTCSYASGCSTAWVPVGTGDLDNDGNQDLTWFNAGSGEVSTWLTDGSGTVLGTQWVDWRCGSGCSSQWRPITLGDFNGDDNEDLLWWNSTSGVVSAWLMNGYGNVLAKQDLDWRCDFPSCAWYESPIGAGDMDNDGRTDLVWFNYQTGVVSTWLLNDYGNVLAKQTVDWRCDATSGCSYQWSPMGVGDLDGNGAQDVVWHDTSSGVVSTWLLNGYGNVLAKQDLDWRCGLASSCSSQWKSVDLVR